MRPGRFLALAMLGALALSVMPPAGQVVVHATPVTLSETLTDLPEAATSTQSKSFSTAGADAAAEDDSSGGSKSTDASRSEVIDAPLTFNLLGVSAPEGASAVRARSFDGEQWSPWRDLDFLDAVNDGPDLGTEEYAEAQAATTLATEPLWVGEATKFQLEVEGAEVGELAIDLIDSMGSSGGPVKRTYETRPHGATADAAEIDIVTRAQWGADESLRSGTPDVARDVNMGVVHHTAHSPDSWIANSYSRAEAPGVMRAMYQYHTKSLGWSDIGYNVVVDRFGTIYEGRAGGFENGVIGAHARGFNTGSFGVSVMGNFYDRQASPEAIASLKRVVGLKSAIHGIDPEGWNNEMADDTWRPNIVGHRDVGSTSCPGLIATLLPEIRSAASDMAVRFPDVSMTSPHRDAILKLSQDGIATGCRLNEYCPKSGLNRGQASSFILRTFELEPVPGSPFRDVDLNGAHTGAINALAELGWLQGYTDGRFGPWDQLTRGQLGTLLANALDLPLETPVHDPYPDVSRTATHAPAIAALKEVGIQGDCGGGRFCANDIALRDSTASFLEMARAYQASGPSTAGSGDENTAEEEDDTYGGIQLGDPTAPD